MRLIPLDPCGFSAAVLFGARWRAGESEAGSGLAE
jgi:hypothetical protein